MFFLNRRYHQYILAALLLFTASSVMDKLLVAKMNLTPISLTAFQHAYFAGLFFIIYFAFKGKLENHSPQINKTDVLWILLISVLDNWLSLHTNCFYQYCFGCIDTCSKTNFCFVGNGYWRKDF